MTKTGWPPGMLQDDDRRLSRWLASRLGARHQVRKNIMEMNDKQPDALRLAEALETDYYADVRVTQAADELRRLHAEVDRLTKSVADERSRCCRIVTGLCISDNNAQEITDAIRKGK